MLSYTDTNEKPAATKARVTALRATGAVEGTARIEAMLAENRQIPSRPVSKKMVSQALSRVS